MKIGIPGTGRMGAAIAERLLAVGGHQVTVWNRSPDKAKRLVGKGAKLAASPAALAADSDVIVTILSDGDAIDAVYRGPQGLLEGASAGKTFIEMSTVRPEVERALAADVVAKGAHMVDCPVGGTIGPAREGKLFGFVGGSAEDFARVKPLLDQMCRRHEHVGGVGAGAAMKLAINLPLLVWYQACGEALSLLGQTGLDPAQVMDIFSDTSGAPAMLKNRAAQIADALKGNEPNGVTINVDLVRKDLRTMLDEAQSLGTDLPLVARALEVYSQASRDGWGARDVSVLPSYWPKHGKR
jgi:3-hydroxyisobutyrate dehydrogenase